MKFKKTPIALAAFALCAAAPFAAQAAPSVSFKAPLAGAQLGKVNYYQSSGCEVTGTNIKRVLFSLVSSSGATTALNTELNAPWHCSLNTANFADGSYTLRAIAYDSANVPATATRSITINKGGSTGGGTTTPPPANPGPTVTFVKPASNATVSGPIACEVTAVDPDGIQKLEWLLDGKLIYTETSAPFNYCNMNTTGLAAGAHTIKARATDKKGAATEAQVSVNVASTGGGGGGTPPPAGGPVDPADIKTRASADVMFTQQPNIYTDVLGSTPWMSTIPESGKHGTALANGETLRFGKEMDPQNSARKAMTFQLANSDPNTGGSKRVELGFPRQIEMNKVYWIAVSVYVHDWGTLATNDQALFGFQLHSGTKLDLSPTIALYTTQNGRTFKVSTRWSTSTLPSMSNSVSAHYAEQPIPFGRWMDFVVKFKQNTSGSGFAQVWLDGNQIVDHQGNLGFNTPGFLDYVKWGYYNWSGSGFSNASRKVRLRNPTIVADPTGSKYTAADVRGLLGAGSDSGTSSASTGTTPTASVGGAGGTTSGDGGVCSTITCAAQ